MGKYSQEIKERYRGGQRKSSIADGISKKYGISINTAKKHVYDTLKSFINRVIDEEEVPEHLEPYRLPFILLSTNKNKESASVVLWDNGFRSNSALRDMIHKLRRIGYEKGLASEIAKLYKTWIIDPTIYNRGNKW